VPSLLHNKFWPDVDDSTTDRLGWLDGQVEVFQLLVHIGAMDVDGFGSDRRDSPRNSLVDQFAKDDAVLHWVEQLFTSDGHPVFEVLVVL
jgi:hypothetical protein